MRAIARDFADDSVLARDPALREYLADLVRPYGVGLREDLLAAGVGHCYGEMGEALIREAVAEPLEVDLLVLAHAVPDVRPGRSTALYLSSVCPGRPQAFGICDQGVAAAFTATRLAGEFLRSGECRTALVLVLEQSVLHYAADDSVQLPDRHAGVAVLYDGVRPEVQQYTAIDRDAAMTRFLHLVDEDEGEGCVFVLGEGLSDVPVGSGGEVVRPKGQPLTGVWAALAEHGERWAREGRRVVLADHDVRTRTLNLCTYEGLAWTR